MTRIQPNTKPDAKSKELLAGVQQLLGSTPNMFTTLAHSSTTLGIYLNAFTSMDNSKLSGALREQIAVVVAGANGCDYCASAHTALGKIQNVPEVELTQNLIGNSGDDKTQAAITFARKVVSLRGNVSDADVESLRKAGFSNEDIVDIVMTICINIFTNYFNHVAGTVVDFPLVSTVVAKTSPDSP